MRARTVCVCGGGVARIDDTRLCSRKRRCSTRARGASSRVCPSHVCPGASSHRARAARSLRHTIGERANSPGFAFMVRACAAGAGAARCCDGCVPARLGRRRRCWIAAAARLMWRAWRWGPGAACVAWDFHASYFTQIVSSEPLRIRELVPPTGGGALSAAAQQRCCCSRGVTTHSSQTLGRST